jgi:hypothetical protein
MASTLSDEALIGAEAFCRGSDPVLGRAAAVEPAGRCRRAFATKPVRLISSTERFAVPRRFGA